jgi:acetylornithine deacetylase/succinyl-diaminopimelate desuccinylase-like protein
VPDVFGGKYPGEMKMLTAPLATEQVAFTYRRMRQHSGGKGSYDVVPAGDEAHWTSPPFEPTERDGSLVGRGVADTKSNVLAHVGALRAWGGRPPVGIKLCIEGDEEIGSGALTGYPPTDPERFQADVLLIGDMGSMRPGVPTLTTALRGMANVVLEVRTLESGKHSGQYGGAAPDALIAVLHALASLHDEHGDVAVAGLRRNEWEGVQQPEEASARSARCSTACR